MGFKYKCFLDAYKGYHQIQMSWKDEEKMTFHTDEEVFCYTKMPFGLKNASATYQRLVDTIFEGQTGRNLEVYVDDMVIKSKTEQDLIQDIEETLLTLKKVNMKLNPKKCSFRMEEGKFLGYIVTSEGIKANPEKTKAVMSMPSPTNLKQIQSLKLPTLTAPMKDDELMGYLSAVDEAVSVVLLVERKGRRMPIHYVSRSLQGTKINYAPMEKLALAQVHAARRLRRYFQGHAIKVVIEKPIYQILNTDTVAGDDPSCKKDPSSEAPLGSKDMSESSKANDEQINQDPVAKVDVWKLYTDGASNDHGSRAGLILIDLGGIEYSYALRLNFNNLNNDAEYEALLAGLRVSKEMKVKNIHAFVDSKLVASQVEGSYEAHGEKTKKYQGKSPRGFHVL
ncbi:reverse transcriptase domain-containing protein [Tanacetum coccineum]